MEAKATAWGGPGIFLTRWLLSPLGPWINLASGTAGYPWHRFLFWDMLGEITGAVVYISLGRFFSDRVMALDGVLGDLTWAIAALLVAIVLGYQLNQPRFLSSLAGRIKSLTVRGRVEIGRRTVLRWLRGQPRGGSSPLARTIFEGYPHAFHVAHLDLSSTARLTLPTLNVAGSPPSCFMFSGTYIPLFRLQLTINGAMLRNSLDS